jgi:hypothetical protein
MDVMVYLVYGLARSGTSLTARILHDLGIPMGERMTPTNPDWCRDGFYEDEEFDTLCRSMQRFDVTNDGKMTNVEPNHLFFDLYSLVKRRNDKYPKWGVKNLVIMYFLIDFWSWCGDGNLSLILCRRPFYEVVQSQAVCKKLGLAQCSQEAGTNLFWVEKTFATFTGPKTEVHYQNVLNSPKEVVKKLAEFCGVPYKEEVADCVDPTQKRF